MKIPGAWMAQQLARTGMTGVKNTTGLDEEAQIDLASIIADVVTQNYPSAAAGAVSLYGDMTNNDALSDNADMAGSVMGLGGVVKGLGKQALKQGAKEIAKEGAEEVAKGAAKEAATAVGKEAATTVAKESATDAAKLVADNAGKDLLQVAAKQPYQDIIKQGAMDASKKTSLKSVLDTVLGEGGVGAKFENGMGKLQTGMSMAEALSPPPAVAPGPSVAPGGFTPTATALRQILAQQGIRPNPFTAQFGGGF